MAKAKVVKLNENVLSLVERDTASALEDRLSINKTYKLYINGSFPRSESGRHLEIKNKQGNLFANASLASRKDLRDALVFARQAQPAWAKRSAYNRGQILYRIAEILENRRSIFETELLQFGSTAKSAKQEVSKSVDYLVTFAGWSDKFQQINSTVNPVNSSHFVFSTPEPVGVVAVICPAIPSLFGLVSFLSAVIVGGNTVVCLASETNPFSAITFSEVLNDSDLPNGVVNILTGKKSELLTHFASHMDINAMIASDLTGTESDLVNKNAVSNLKRVIIRDTEFFSQAKISEHPKTIIDTQEIKTTWHPVGR